MVAAEFVSFIRQANPAKRTTPALRAVFEGWRHDRRRAALAHGGDDGERLLFQLFIEVYPHPRPTACEVEVAVIGLVTMPPQ
jgi:hypothetical protein